METTTTSTGGGHNGLKVLVIVGGVVILFGAGAYFYSKRKKAGFASASVGDGTGGAGTTSDSTTPEKTISPTIANGWKGELGQNGGQVGLDTQSALKDAWVKLYQSNVKGTKDAEIAAAQNGHNSTWYSVRPDEKRKRDERVAAIQQKWNMPEKDSPLFPYSGSPIWDMMGDFIFNKAKKNPTPADLTAFEDFMNTIAGKYGTDNAWFTKVAMSKVPYLRLYVPYVK